MKYSARGKWGIACLFIAIVGFPACLVNGEIPVASAFVGCLIWAALGALLIFWDRKNGGKKTAQAVMKSSSQPSVKRKLSTSPEWQKWDGQHEAYEQLMRIRRAKGKEFLCRQINAQLGEAVFLGRDGLAYTTTLSECTCPDFEKRGLPCKHMYYLASKMDLIDFDEYLK